MKRLRAFLRAIGYHAARLLAWALIIATAGMLWVADQFDVEIEDL